MTDPDENSPSRKTLAQSTSLWSANLFPLLLISSQPPSCQSNCCVSFSAFILLWRICILIELISLIRWILFSMFKWNWQFDTYDVNKLHYFPILHIRILIFFSPVPTRNLQKKSNINGWASHTVIHFSTTPQAVSNCRQDACHVNHRWYQNIFLRQWKLICWTSQKLCIDIFISFHRFLLSGEVNTSLLVTLLSFVRHFQLVCWLLKSKSI